MRDTIKILALRAQTPRTAHEDVIEYRTALDIWNDRVDCCVPYRKMSSELETELRDVASV